MHNSTHSKKKDEEMKRKKGEEIWEAQTNDEKERKRGDGGKGSKG
jgi:hypothetical protein